MRRKRLPRIAGLIQQYRLPEPIHFFKMFGPSVLNHRIKDWANVDEVGAEQESPVPSSITNDAETALVSLGYKPQQAARAIAQVLKVSSGINDSEELIRQSLKTMG